MECAKFKRLILPALAAFGSRIAPFAQPYLKLNWTPRPPQISGWQGSDLALAGTLSKRTVLNPRNGRRILCSLKACGKLLNWGNERGRLRSLAVLSGARRAPFPLVQAHALVSRHRRLPFWSLQQEQAFQCLSASQRLPGLLGFLASRPLQPPLGQEHGVN